MSKVLLFGGTGAMGAYLSEILVSLGHEVVITSRKQHGGGTGKRFIVGDAMDADFAYGVLEREHPDAVVDFMIYSTTDFTSRCGTYLSRTGQYVFISSYRVFSGVKPITERSPRLLESIFDSEYLKTDEYALCKARSEDALRSSGRTNWTIIRPAITYSPKRFQLGCLEADVLGYRALSHLPVVIPQEMMDIQATMTHGSDVAKMISRLILNPQAYGEDFNCATAEHHAWRDVAHIYTKALGLCVIPCPLEAYAGYCAGRAQTLYDRMYDRILDNSKVLSATGLRQEDLVTLEKGLTSCLTEYISNPIKTCKSVVQNAKLDNLTGARMSLSGFSWRDKLRYWEVRKPALARLVSLVR